MEKTDLGKMFEEQKDYPNHVIKEFWDNLPDKQKNDFVNRGKVDTDKLKKFFKELSTK